MSLQVRQTSKARRSDWWQWSVWLDGPAPELDQVDAVEYVLHPSFSDPVRRVKDRSTQFRLDASGWGEFKLHIHIHRRDGSVEKTEHWLQLGEDAQSKDLSFGSKAPPVPSKSEGSGAIYLSYSVADTEMMGQVEQALSNQGMTVLTVEDCDPDLPFDDAFRRIARRVDCGVVAVSGMTGANMAREIGALERNQKPIIVLAIGSDARLPRQMSSYPKVQIKEGSDPANVAARILEVVRKVSK